MKETFNPVAMHLPKLCHLILEKLFRAQDQVIINVDTYHTEKFLRGWIAKQKESGNNFDFSAPSSERIVSRCSKYHNSGASLSPYTPFFAFKIVPSGM